MCSKFSDLHVYTKPIPFLYYNFQSTIMKTKVSTITAAHLHTCNTVLWEENGREIFWRWLRRVSLGCVEGGCQLKEGWNFGMIADIRVFPLKSIWGDMSIVTHILGTYGIISLFEIQKILQILREVMCLRWRFRGQSKRGQVSRVWGIRKTLAYIQNCAM